MGIRIGLDSRRLYFARMFVVVGFIQQTLDHNVKVIFAAIVTYIVWACVGVWCMGGYWCVQSAHASVFVCVYVYVYVYVRVCVCMCMCKKFTYACICMCAHSFIPTHTNYLIGRSHA